MIWKIKYSERAKKDLVSIFEIIYAGRDMKKQV